MLKCNGDDNNRLACFALQNEAARAYTKISTTTDDLVGDVDAGTCLAYVDIESGLLIIALLLRRVVPSKLKSVRPFQLQADFIKGERLRCEARKTQPQHHRTQ